MARERTAERASLVAGMATALGLVAVSIGPFPSGHGTIPDEIAQARERLDRAMVVRYGPPSEDQDERFDVLIGALCAGLGNATPSALRDAVESIRSARVAEREASRASVVRGERVRPFVVSGVDTAVARSERLLSYLTTTSDSSAPETGWESLFLLAAAVAAMIAMASTCLANRWRRAERESIAALVGAPRDAAHDGRLRAEVGRHIAVVMGRARASERRTHERSTQIDRATTPPEPLPRDEPIASLGFGRILEIRPDEPDAWGDG
jgi:hypothetical protein